jgi:hypothetical protein
MNQRQMQVNGMFAAINTPPALSGDFAHGLPPYGPCSAYAVDEWPSCPDNWEHGSSKASSYFVPVRSDRGMWFDFTANSGHTHNVAVVVSVQGVNPITGKKVTALNLEQYRDTCPECKITFQQDRYCPQCKYKWPAQNYLASTTGHKMWIDGFRNEQGEVRQYIITEEEMRGVAAQVIGKDRVWAIGFAFYLSKEPKPHPTRGIMRSMSLGADGDDQDVVAMAQFGLGGSAVQCCSYGPKGMSGQSGPSGQSANINSLKCYAHSTSSVSPSVSPSDSSRQSENIATKLEIGAGSRIVQEHGVDPNPIDYWQGEPVGLIYANYISEAVAQQIFAAGKRQDKPEGALQGLKVGN